MAKRGFGSMDEQKQKKIARKGAKAQPAETKSLD